MTGRESPKLIAEYPLSISSRGSFSRESFSSEDTGVFPVGRPRHHTLPSSPLPSSLSSEVPPIAQGERTSVGNDLQFLGAGRFFRPGSEDQSGWRRLRERASWTKSLPRQSDSRSAWPSASQRDLLKEAGDWLDAHFPVPDPQTPEDELELPSSPLRESFSPTSLGDSSRPGSSSTTREDIDDGTEGKIVYNERENKLRDLLDKIQKDCNSGKAATAATPSREARVRRYLKEIQAQNENQASAANIMSQEPVELDATVLLRPTKGRMEQPSPDPPSQDDLFPYESAKESLLLCESLEDEHYWRPLPTVDISRVFDPEFSAATTRAVNDLPSPDNLESNGDAEAAKTPTPTALPKPQADYFAIDSSSHKPPPAQRAKRRSETTPVLQPSLTNRNSTASFKPNPAISNYIPTTPPTPQMDRLVLNDTRKITPLVQPPTLYFNSPTMQQSPPFTRNSTVSTNSSGAISDYIPYVPTARARTCPDHSITGSSRGASPPTQPATPYFDSYPVLQSSPINRDSTASANSSRAMSDKISLGTSGSSDVMSSPREVLPREVSMDKMTRTERSPVRGIFDDLESLMRVSRTRHSDVRVSH